MGIYRAITPTVMVAFLCSAIPASALEIFGMRFFEGVKDEANVQDPIFYSLGFSSTDAPEELADALRAASDLWAERKLPAAGSAGLLGMANSDYRSLLATLYSAGYYSPDISILIGNQEASEVPFMQNFPSEVPVQIYVVTGPIFRFGDVDLGPLAPASSIRRNYVDAPYTAGLKSGDPALAGAVGAAADLAVEGWRQQGFPLANVSDRSIVADHRDQTLDVLLRIDPGKRATYGATKVSGNERMDADFLRYMANLPEGEEYDPDDLAAARARLVQLAVFRSIKIEEAGALSENNTLPVTLYVDEQPLRRIGFGATLSSIDGLGAEAYWIHRNLFGRAERLRFEASIDGIESQDGIADADYSLGARFTKPGVFRPDIDFSAAISAKRVHNGEIDNRGVNMSFGLEYAQGTWDVGISAFGAFAETRDDFGLRYFRLAGLLTEATLDKRSDPLDPSGGYYLATTLSAIQEYDFGNTGIRGTIEGRGYYGLGEGDKFVLAGRARIGSLSGIPVNESPADLLFFSGGGNSVRGFGFESIGLTDGLVFTGGLSTINLSAELRMHVSDTIGIVGFVDAGTVGPDALPDPSGEWHSGVGIGLRYHTGLGPLRLDIARGLDLRPSDPEYAIYLGLGQTF